MTARKMQEKKRNKRLSRPLWDGGCWKTYLALRDLFNARPDKDAHFLIEEAILGRATNDKPTWRTRAVTTREYSLASAYTSADMSNGGWAGKLREHALVKVFIASFWRQSTPGGL